MRALVLGGAGFIGSHLVSRLLELQYEVAVLDVIESPLTAVNSYVGQVEDPELLQQAIQSRDIVLHAISTTVPGTSVGNMEFDITSNLVSLVRILETMKECGVSRIAYISSGGAIYGNPMHYPIREEHALNPISSYGVVKLAAEKYLNMFLHFQHVLLLHLHDLVGAYLVKTDDGAAVMIILEILRLFCAAEWNELVPHRPEDVAADYIECLSAVDIIERVVIPYPDLGARHIFFTTVSGRV